MSRSYKRPGHYVCGGHMKPWKRESNRKLRRYIRAMIAAGEDFTGRVVPILREVSDIWCSPGDGKVFYSPWEFRQELREEDPRWNPLILIRK